jgi:transposase
MLSFPASVRLFVCRRPVDFRCGFDRLAALAREHLALDPLCGHLFIFRNKKADRLKILDWEPAGFALWYKRLEVGPVVFPKGGVAATDLGGDGLEITAAELAMLLDGVDTEHVRRRPRYHRPA